VGREIPISVLKKFSTIFKVGISKIGSLYAEKSEVISERLFSAWSYTKLVSVGKTFLQNAKTMMSTFTNRSKREEATSIL
jgi:hypothetical protein